MIMIFGLAWQNLWRDRRRTVGALAALAVGVAALLLLFAWTRSADGGVLLALRILFAVCAAVIGLVAVLLAVGLVRSAIGARLGEIALLRAIGFSLARVVTLLGAEIAMLGLGAGALALASVWIVLALGRDHTFATAFVIDDPNAHTLVALAVALVAIAATTAAWLRLRQTVNTGGGALAAVLSNEARISFDDARSDA